MTDRPHAHAHGTTAADDEKSLPHDRDEKPEIPVENAQHGENRKSIDQAHDDVESGIQDTERIGIPSDVPSSGKNEG